MSSYIMVIKIKKLNLIARNRTKTRGYHKEYKEIGKRETKREGKRSMAHIVIESSLRLNFENHGAKRSHLEIL